MSERSPAASHDSALPAALAAQLLTGWAADEPGRPAAVEAAAYTAKRRAALAARFPGETLVAASGTPKVRANDTDYPFRADSDYSWLTADNEPDRVLVLRPGGEATLYLAARLGRTDTSFFADRRGELWVGRQAGPAEVSAQLGLDARPLAALDLDTLAPDRVLRGVDPRLDALGTDPERDAELARACAELRLVKDDWELAQLRSAAEATARGFADVVGELGRAEGRSERWLEGTFWRRARYEGNDVGYSSIVAAGPHATTLHWTRNDGRLRGGDLLLLDMGVELPSLYTADVTRTLPVGGEYSPDQLRLLELVYAAQQAGLAAAQVGADFLAPNRAAQQVLAGGLHDWGILPVAPQDALAADGPGAGLHRRYTLHNVSHMLGLDVHDCARSSPERYLHGRLEVGMALTVEPGLYFQPDDLTVPPELRGLGARLEDDIAITRAGPVILSDQLPRAPAELARWLAAAR